MTTAAPYPVRVDATLEPPLSRWLWLVKWILVIPHYVVLVFLWIAFAVLSIGAFFAILFTGRYPRSIFEFNVGVLRWTWRVQYYAFGAFATDRYPPFTLDDVADYPAHLEIAYPAHLSRGLVLIKWWLLAIPHYIVVGLFVSGGAWFAWHVGDDGANWVGGGLIGLLALIAAVVLAFTGRYPQGIYDFVLGMNRWVLRVAAYAGLMTDEYPPFRFDMGGHEPQDGTVTLPPPPPPAPTGITPPAEPSAGPSSSGWTAGRVVTVVIGGLLLLVSFGLFSGGGVVLWADQHRDGGYVTSNLRSYDGPGYALTSERVSIGSAGFDWGWQSDILGDVRIRAADTAAAPVFVGIGPTAEVNRYLSGVAHTVYGDFDSHDDVVTLPGQAPAAAPTTHGFWAATSTGPGRQSLVWPVQSGDWTVVVMNADAGRGVHVRADIGATLPALTWVATGLLIAGGVLLLLGLTLVIVPVRRAMR